MVQQNLPDTLKDLLAFPQTKPLATKLDIPQPHLPPKNLTAQLAQHIAVSPPMPIVTLPKK